MESHIKVLGTVPASEIPGQNRAGSGVRNGLYRQVREILNNLPPVGKYTKIRHDYSYATKLSSRFCNVARTAGLPINFKVIVRGQYAFIGRKGRG